MLEIVVAWSINGLYCRYTPDGGSYNCYPEFSIFGLIPFLRIVEIIKIPSKHAISVKEKFRILPECFLVEE